MANSMEFSFAMHTAAIAMKRSVFAPIFRENVR